MNNLKYLLYTVVISAFALSCNDDFVSTQPLGEVPKEVVWTDAALAEAFVFEIYNGFGVGGFYEQQLASMTDEALFTHPGRGINTVNEGRANAADQGYIMDTYQYGNMYTRIRAANTAIMNLQNPQFDNPTKASQLLGEAYFLRAYYYHQLVRMFGSVPLVNIVYELGDPDYTLSRNTFEECIDFIVDDCDSAALLLAEKQKVDGRANEIAALALKARVLTYAASDLFDNATARSKSDVLGDYANPEYLGYTTGDRMQRWQKAKEASKAVLDHAEYRYKLDLDGPVTAEEGRANYTALAMGGGSKLADTDAKRDLILGRFFIDLKDERGGWVGRDNGPNGYHNWSGNTPTQLLVDDYEMINGNRFDWNNPEHKAAPYRNRDPRFYATILYDGADWKPRTDDVKNRDPYNQIQTGQYEIGNGSGTKTVQFGLDTRNGPIEDWNGSYTGYYYRKFVDADPAIVDQNTRQSIPWPILRYTEAVLNYVEACIELGEEQEAKLWINRIRFRSGMPAINDSGEALKRRYQNERRIELAYEEHRFFDARRWMIAPQTLGRKVSLIRIEGKLKPGKQVSVYRYNTENYNYTYTVGTLDPGIENRTWNDKMYFAPFHRDETNRNTKLVQNPGY
ncbi:putative outer membrane starch-binding protein [Sphingobacterium allocomposti]|uniref:Putative outer membrane starch-binding protein n=1 Tax=Sphingobacterium allocomposti TaxID=415956 RepID=A0A5S5DNE2_9SPHI|nr:RagB/SusD family nutrient uptake outer membrane protein [Sphingobacterium composti Yoo et al. 2007 non Ten et al. 2007]TYP97235.1 putative outer membrane starch-binding protein [Sphingobacterium composti Yoo et al. 2007 non Ten et al. 2007]